MEPSWENAPTVVQMLQTTPSQQPQPFLAGVPATGLLVSGDSMMTFRQLASAANQAARDLSAILRPHEPIGLVMDGSGGAVVLLLAAWESDHPAVLIPPTLLTDETEEAIDAAGIRCFAGMTDPGGADQRVTIRAVRPASNGALDMPAGAAIVQMTSGSTGASRLAVRTRAGIRAEIHAMAERLRVGPSDCVLCAPSVAHSYGLVAGLLVPLSCGATAVLARGPADAVGLVDAREPTIVVGLAATYGAFLDTTPTKRLRSVRFAMSAGAPLPTDLGRRFQEAFELPIRQDYGTTEAGTITMDTDEAVSPETVGRPLEHVEVRLVPTVLASGEKVDEVQARSPAIAPWYLGPEGARSVVDVDGWYATRDTGSWDSAGRLLLGPRIRAPLLVSGVALQPETIEDVLEAFPGIVEAVASVVDGRVHATVVAHDLDSEALLAWCGTHLDPLSTPVTVEVRTDLPRSPAGKVLLKYL